MKTRWLAVLGTWSLLGATSALAAGCKAGTCESVCEQQNTCEGAQQIPDCASYCDAETRSAEDTGCKDEYDSMISCQGTISSCDTQSTFCTGQSAAYLKCVSDACAADPTKCQGG